MSIPTARISPNNELHQTQDHELPHLVGSFWINQIPIISDESILWKDRMQPQSRIVLEAKSILFRKHNLARIFL